MSPSRWSRTFAAAVVITDLALINGSFLATSLLKFGTIYPSDSFAPIYLKFQVFLNLLFPVCLALGGAYRDVARSPVGHQATASFKACVWASGVTLAAHFLARNTGYSRLYVTFHLVQVVVLIPFSRILLERLSLAARLRGHGVTPVVCVGEREPLQDLALRLRMAPNLGYRVEAVLPVGFDPPGAGYLPPLARDGTEREQSMVRGGRPEPGHGGEPARERRGRDLTDAPRVLRRREELRQLLASGHVRRIFICDHDIDRGRWKEVVDLAEELQVETRLVRWPLLVPDFRGRIHDLLSVPLVPARVAVRCRGLLAVVKRAMDLGLASLAVLLLAPFFLLTAVAIKLDSPGPVFYRQARLTRGGRRFDILKFRSMHSLADEDRARLGEANEATGPLFKMRRDPRVTRVGQWLRRFSLDELPQILNVVLGDLSLVGPRPPLPEEVEKYEPWQRHRLDVVQGMTGLWQVSGRSRLSFEEMALLDLAYIEKWSPLLDVEILMETVPTVLHGDGAF